MSRTVNVVVANLTLVQAVVIGVILGITGRELAEPVTVAGSSLTTVNIALAVVILVAFAALMRFASLGGWDLRWIEQSQVSAITVFLVAQLNGITEVAALVPLYALSAAGTLFLVLHSRSGDRLTYIFGAAVGIVPWGVIAFYQIALAPSLLVRVITLAMLAVAISTWAAAYRKSSRMLALLPAVGASVLPWLVLAETLA
jgi:hypothetical protein